MKAKPTTKEQLVYFLHNHISLGTYDKKFINNLIVMYVTPSNPTTTNQSHLLDKIILRYARQLRKEEIDANEMVNLPWGTSPVESSPKYTEAYVEINNEVIEIRSPFKSEFIKQFKELTTARWDKDTKVWYINASEKNLKSALELVRGHYEKVNYCPQIAETLNIIEAYKDVRYWNPTLVKVNGLLYIVAINNSLNEAIKDIPLDDNLPTLARLSFHGVTISRSVLNDISKDITDEQISFATERNLTFEYDPIALSANITAIGADYVLLREWNVLDKTISSAFKERLEQKGIKVVILDRRDKPTIEEIKEAKMPVMVSGYSFYTSLSEMFAKNIGLTNNKPIIIK